MTVQKLDAPSLHLVSAGRGLDEPACGRRIRGTGPRCVRTQEDSHAAPALGGKLQPPRFDLAETFNKRDGRADPSTSQAFGQCPQLVGTSGTAKQDQAAQLDPRGRHGGQVQFPIRIAPGDGATLFLSRPSEQ